MTLKLILSLLLSFATLPSLKEIFPKREFVKNVFSSRCEVV